MKPSIAIIALSLLVVSCESSAPEEPCSNLEGVWRNDLGSVMNLEHTAEGELRGKYQTAVSLQNPQTTATGYDIYGVYPHNREGAVFGFSVMWRNDGRSMTTWTGQCVIREEDGEEILETSWLLKTRVDGCSETWKSTNIGQDTFRRYRNATLNGNAMRRFSTDNQRVRQRVQIPDISRGNVITGNITLNTSTKPCESLSGYWYNDLGSEMYIQTDMSNTLKGVYRTAVERYDGSAGSGSSKVIGVSNTDDPTSTISLLVVWKDGASITGWVGQCHVCGETRTETLKLTWLLRSRVDTRDDIWSATNYGENTFTRHEQRMGPRGRDGKHTPRDIGKKGKQLSNAPCSGHVLTVGAMLTLSIILTVHVIVL